MSVRVCVLWVRISWRGFHGRASHGRGYQAWHSLLWLSGVALMDVHLIGVDLMDVRLIGVALMSVSWVCLSSVWLPETDLSRHGLKVA